jgi:outer membrane receptor protein involved in Fe transport
MPDSQPEFSAPRDPITSVGRAVLFTLALVASLTLGPAPAWAQESEAPARIAQAGSGAQQPAAGADEEEAAGAAPIAPPPGVEVIRVTGRPLAAIETEVPESATQFDTAALEALGAEDVSDLAKVSPNLEIRTAGSTAPTFFIRGVGLSDFNANAAGAVSVYQDEVAINAPAIQLGQLYDVENIEVLRGPQGGGSGRNASAGAIKVYSRKPTGELAAEMRTTLGRYESDLARHALLQDYEGALEIPLVEETLATRLAFRFSGHDPYATNSCGGTPTYEERGLAELPVPGQPNNITLQVVDPEKAAKYKDKQFCGEHLSNLNYYPPGSTRPVRQGNFSSVPGVEIGEVNDGGSWAARGQLRFQPPGTEMDWLLNLHGSRLDQLSTLGQAMGTYDRYEGELGNKTAKQYIEPDNIEMKTAIQDDVNRKYPYLSPEERTQMVSDILANELARNLDIQPYRGDYERVGRTRLDAWGGFLRGEGSIGPVHLTSISAYDTYERFRDEDYDFTPDVLFEALSTDEAWQFTQELRLGAELAETPLRWEAGGYYLMEQLSARIQSDVELASQSPLRVYDQDLWSFGLYAGFSWDFLDDFTLEGGVRYNWERKAFDFSLDKPSLQEPKGVVNAATWQAPTGTISLSYRFNEDVSAYWKYSRGWKGGHFNASALVEEVDAGLQPVEPETIDAFEVGLRGRFLDGRLGLGVAGFYYEYTNYQVFVVEDDLGAPPTYKIINANDAEVYGAELDFRAEPLAGWVPNAFDGLVLTGRLGWLETQFLDFTDEVYRQQTFITENGTQGSRALPVLVDYSGNQLINSPKLKASLGAEWTLDLGRWGALIPRYDFAWTDDVFFDPSEGRGLPNPAGELTLPEYAIGQRAFWLHNARLAYRTPASNIEIACWVHNFTDEVYKTYAFDASAFARVVINFVGEPRTWGVSLSVNW